MIIIKATTETHFQWFRSLLNRYAEIRNYDEALGDLKKELALLPGEYKEPDGCLLIATTNDIPCGCAALRKINNLECEMKRLFVFEQFRNQGIGRKLIQEIITVAKELGYKTMKLDTHPWMKNAIQLYESIGFYEIARYNPNPTIGIRFFELKL